MGRKRLVVLGTLAGNPYAGMAWMHMQIAAGLKRLGHDVYYFEVSSYWPYDPVRESFVDDSQYAVPYLARIAASFGLHGRWAYRRSYSDKAWIGMDGAEAQDMLQNADAVFNVAGATDLHLEQLEVGNLIYYGTDPGWDEIGYACGEPEVRRFVDRHDAFATYAENIGKPDCLLPPLPGTTATTRQPILTDLWGTDIDPRPILTTVGNWKHEGRDREYLGETYTWSKHHEFLKFIEAPRQAGHAVELATATDQIPAADKAELALSGWKLVDGHAFSREPWPYWTYIHDSLGEFTVAKDMNVRMRTGWFSERSACYLAAGRPVITQDTGFGGALPVGEGLLAFATMDEAVEAIQQVHADYEKHSKAAREIADEYFRAETVLKRLLEDLGLGS